jgi:hypothetical protein
MPGIIIGGRIEDADIQGKQHILSFSISIWKETNKCTYSKNAYLAFSTTAIYT